MTRQYFDDETVMAFADGELDEATASALERALAHDEELALRVAMFAETRALAAAELSSAHEGAVPEELRASVARMVDAAREREAADRPAAIVPLRRAANDPGRRPGFRFMVPLAASLVAVAAGIGGYALGTTGEAPSPGLSIAGLTVEGLPEALDKTMSGDTAALAGPNSRFRAIATFRDEADQLCREFEVDQAGKTVVSVACRDEAQWQVNFAVVAPGDGDGYAPASSLDALDAYLSAIGAGEPMAADEEGEALTGGR